MIEKETVEKDSEVKQGYERPTFFQGKRALQQMAQSRHELTHSFLATTLFPKKRVYFDTFVFMDLLAGGEYAEKAKQFLQQEGVISSVLLTEIGFHVSRRKRTRADEILFYIQSLPGLTIAPVTPEIAMLAGKLRAKYRNRIKKHLTYFDSIHLATAVTTDCNKFITGDRGFQEITELPVEVY